MAEKTEILRDIEETLGFVPEWIAQIPEHSIEAEWSLFKNWELAETTIPGKYKELIGLAVAANMQCDYCVAYHTELARSYGANDEEINETSLMAKTTAGWSSYLQGMQVDLDQFKKDVQRIRARMQEAKAA